MNNEFVSREWLLENGFEWTKYINNDYGEHSGEYVLSRRCGDNPFVILLKFKDVGYRSGNPATWLLIVSTRKQDRRVELRDALKISIKELKDACKLCGIKVRFKKCNHKMSKL